MVMTATPSTQRVTLHNISWQTFETILAEMGEDRASRLAYDRGTLEIMTPLMPHEHNNRLLDHLIVVLALELNLPLKSAGSLTCKRQDLLLGGEPDSCFYIQNEPKVRNKRDIDLATDPPPDESDRGGLHQKSLWTNWQFTPRWASPNCGVMMNPCWFFTNCKEDGTCSARTLPPSPSCPSRKFPSFWKTVYVLGKFPCSARSALGSGSS